MSEQSFFKVRNVGKINEIAEKFLSSSEEDIIIPTSDLCIQNDKYFIQFELESEDSKRKVELKAGLFNIEKTSAGLDFFPMDIQETNLLETSKAYVEIGKEFDNFFERLDIYDELKILKKRGALLYGPPGTGKSANISKSLKKLVKGGDAAVVIWNSSSIRSDDVLTLFTNGIKYHPDVKKLSVIIEDIGMGVEGYGGPKEVDRSLLNLLDGANSVIKIPTFFVATTNYAHNLPEPLIRPGRFDAWIEIGLPTSEERVQLVEFFSREVLSEDDKNAIMGKDLNDFSIAHVKELVIRSKRDGKTYKEVIKELKDFKDKFKKGFENKKSGGGLLV